MDAVDPPREAETVGLMKDEVRGESSREARRRWSDENEFSDNEEALSPGESEDGASMMSSGVSKVKAAQAVWCVHNSSWSFNFGSV